MTHSRLPIFSTNVLDSQASAPLALIKSPHLRVCVQPTPIIHLMPPVRRSRSRSSQQFKMELGKPQGVIHPRVEAADPRPPTGCVSCWTSTSHGVPAAAARCIGRNSSLRSHRWHSPAFRTANATSAPGILPKPRFSNDPDRPSDPQNREPLAPTAKALRARPGCSCAAWPGESKARR